MRHTAALTLLTLVLALAGCADPHAPADLTAARDAELLESARACTADTPDCRQLRSAAVARQTQRDAAAHSASTKTFTAAPELP